MNHSKVRRWLSIKYTLVSSCGYIKEIQEVSTRWPSAQTEKMVLASMHDSSAILINAATGKRLRTFKGQL